MSKNLPFGIALFTLLFGFGLCYGNQPATPLSRQATVSHKVELNILSLGAKGDGIFLNTAVIQLAIDSAASMGGGKVIFPAGRYLSGSIVLKTGVHLLLQQNAVLNIQHLRTRR